LHCHSAAKRRNLLLNPAPKKTLNSY